MASERYEKAKREAMAGYLNPGREHLNCAQTVISCALGAAEGDQALVGAGSYLGGGMVRMGQICGALSGAAVALGLCERLGARQVSREASSVFAWMQQLVRDFEAKFGAVTCRDLVGCDMSSAEAFRQAKRDHATAQCPEFVGYVCDRLAEIVDSEEAV